MHAALCAARSPRPADASPSDPLTVRLEGALPALDLQAGDYLELFGAGDIEAELAAAFAASFADAGLRICPDPRGGFVLCCVSGMSEASGAPGAPGAPGATETPTLTSPAPPLLPSVEHPRVVLHRVRRIA